MSYAIIENNIIVNIVEAEADFANALGWIDAGVAGIGWTWDGTQFSPPLQLPAPTQRALDEQRYQLRAAAKDGLIAWMAADNMARVRAGTWAVADLTALLSDLASVNAMMQTLGFELAAQAIAASTNPLLTADIKTAWVAKLTEHFYSGG